MGKNQFVILSHNIPPLYQIYALFCLDFKTKLSLSSYMFDFLGMLRLIEQRLSTVFTTEVKTKLTSLNT